MKRLILLILLFAGANVAEAARLKDIADVEGVRGNDLIGYGLVVGLKGTGDKSGATFTNQSVANMLERLGIRVDAQTLKVANVAAVVVTAKLPPFARAGSKLDVTLSSIGDAQTLQGGVLTMTPLKGADGKVYAAAQGSISIGGFSVEGTQGDTAQKNHPTVGRIANGATVERAIPFDLFSSGQIRVVLREPDFVTATRVQNEINKIMGDGRAKAIDSASVMLPLSERELTLEPIKLIADLEQISIEPDSPAKVVVNERTGTIIMGENVNISTVAVAHGNLNITIKNETQVSQPNALAGGETAVVQNEAINVGEEGGQLVVMKKSVKINDVVNALNALGATPRDLIAIFQALQRAGALQAELEIM
ncbi:MAG: flagellar basal body P-ring protein FlgI [Deltaproteobacteria bacterium]|nr:flagellar basal body P-ring protein FlgI [Deltaproteobacteria bacterium]